MKEVFIQISINNSVGIASDFAELNISVFPNPSNGSLSLQWAQTMDSNLDVSLYNTAGVQCFSTSIEAISVKETTLHLNQLPGVYLLKVKNNQHAFVKRIIIE